MDNPTGQSKTATPPYIGIAKLDKMMGYISGRNFSEVKPSLFTNIGFGNVDALLAYNTLKFLGFIDEEGKATDLMPKLRLSGEARKKEFEKLIKKAYEKIFATVPTPQDLQSSELLSDFRTQYNLSDRVGKAAVPAFLKLMEYAGLKDEGSIIGRVRQPKGKTSASVLKNKSAPLLQKSVGRTSQTEQSSTGSASIIISLSDDLAVLISPELNSLVNLDDKLNQKWRAALKDFQTISNEAKLKEKSDPQKLE